MGLVPEASDYQGPPKPHGQRLPKGNWALGAYSVS